MGSVAKAGGSRPSDSRLSRVWQVARCFLSLGATSFGGPIAHLGYFRRELVERRGWVSEGQYAQLLAICQFLPGPASSQLGFGLGLLRAGWWGALAAFVAFTLPSALLMFAFAVGLPAVSGDLGLAAIHGLKIVALVVVAHGVAGMAPKLCPDLPRIAIAAVTAGVLLAWHGAWIQLSMVALGAVAGWLLCRSVKPMAVGELAVPHGPRLGAGLLCLFLALLFLLPWLTPPAAPWLAAGEGFYRAGALVFGGGHVVLPWLEELVVAPGWVPREEFLAGYGAAQAVPGPMFSFASFLGARLFGGEGGLAGAALATLGIFLPGFLLLAGVLPLWRLVARHIAAARAVAGVNAAVVGLLAATLWNPIATTAVRGPTDLLIAASGFALFARWRLPAWAVVLWCVGCSVAVSGLS